MADVTEDAISHRIMQLSLFLPNRLGAMLRVHRTLDASRIKVRGITILDAADHAVVRLVCDQPTLAAEILRNEGTPPVESELLGVALPSGGELKSILTAVIAAELNVHYMYALLTPVDGRTVLALHVESPDAAARVLLGRGFRLVNQDALGPE